MPGNTARTEAGSPAEVVGERIRRAALGALAALVVARPYWPSEDATRGTGLAWTLAVLAVAGVGLLAMAVAGQSRARWSWADVAGVAVFVLIGMSAGQAAERRAAINLAWELGGIGLVYLLARNLVRTRGEASGLALAFVASAVAVAAYGLYQVAFELPDLRARYRADPERTLIRLGFTPDPATRAQFENRLLYSNDAWSTFALANSLAGFLVGPVILVVAVGLEMLAARQRRWSERGVALALASIPALVLLSCLMATKSRSAALGAAVGVAFLAWRRRKLLSPRMLAAVTAAGALTLAGLITLGFAAGQLDREVLTQSTLSLRYRSEYWAGAWRVIGEVPGAFWRGVGPGNFAGPYLAYKLPRSSEEVVDPHNFVLDLWATAGLIAVAAFAVATALAFRTLVRSPRADSVPEGDPRPSPDSSGFGWVVGWGGLGWLVVVALGELNPFQEDLFARWLILGGAWLAGVALLAPAWSRGPLPSDAYAAAIVAILVNLLAAGGIAMPAVALAFWLALALGQVVRSDLPAGRLRVRVGRLEACGLAIVWAALAGIFAGAIGPYWRSQAATAEAEALLARRTGPEFDRARSAYLRAIEADRLDPEPWLGLANLELRFWLSPESKGDPRVWPRVLLALDGAVSPPRNPDSVALQRRRAATAHAIRERLGSNAEPGDELMIRTYIARATRIASRLYPTNASIRAELAQASADLGMTSDAAREAREALRLDESMPHRDKKLPADVRARLEERLPEWSAAPDPLRK